MGTGFQEKSLNESLIKFIRYKTNIVCSLISELRTTGRTSTVVWDGKETRERFTPFL